MVTAAPAEDEQIRTMDFGGKWGSGNRQPGGGGRVRRGWRQGDAVLAEPGVKEDRLQAGRGAAGASGERMLGGSLETEKRNCRATSMVLME